MPRYDFACTQCGKRLTYNATVAQRDNVACPCCGCTMDRSPAAPAVQFKGAGWTPKHYGDK